jgi:Lipocalin-like domain
LNEGLSMKKLLLIGLMSLVVQMPTVSNATQAAGQNRSGSGDEAIRDRFVGAWRLVWLEQPSVNGKLHRIDCCGMLVYTRDGHMSVQVMERNPQAHALAGTEQYSQGGYEASYGRYDVAERTHTFIFHVEGALVRGLIGKDLPRAYEFSGKQLIVKSTRPDEHWRVAWERY